ncbi:MAG: hypothetical protein M3O32_20780 [Actinomycetota bacterium]|nr:hypothetical protein [Actinomycetota bacterium]
MTEPHFQPRALFTALDRHHVEYVLVGGYAASQHGAMRPTKDIDVVPATTSENLARLAAALKELRAGIRVDDLPEGLPFDTSAEALRGMTMLNLRTAYGDLDLTFTPSGTEGYTDLIRGATVSTVDGVTVHLAALEDVIRSKRAANRAKDLAALPELLTLALAQHKAAHDRRRREPTKDAGR